MATDFFGVMLKTAAIPNGDLFLHHPHPSDVFQEDVVTAPSTLADDGHYGLGHIPSEVSIDRR